VQRARTIRIVVGMVFLIAAVAVAWRPVLRWSQWVYWYQYRPTFLLMRDLRNGNGKPAPPNNPLIMAFRHGWLSEEVDLARVALHELLRSDKDGKLSAEYRHEIDEMEIANLGLPKTSPVQYDFDFDLSNRLAAGTLTPDEQAKIYQAAVTVDAHAQPLVMQWDDVPIQLHFKTLLPEVSTWAVTIRYISVQIDGKKANWSPNEPWAQRDVTSLIGVGDYNEDRFISYTALGQHRIDLNVQIDIHYAPSSYPERGPVLHGERRALSAWFVEKKPTTWVKIVRLALNPPDQAEHYLPPRWLEYEFLSGCGYLMDLGFSEMTRRDELGELGARERDLLVDRILADQKNLIEPWNAAYGDYLEALRAADELPDEKWREYGAHQLVYFARTRHEIREGDPLPIEVVTLARRGNSRVEKFSPTQWSAVCGFDSGIRCSELDYWNGPSVFCLPNNLCPQFSTRYVARFSDATPGLHTLWTKVKLADLTWTERPQNMEIPTQYDLNTVEYSVLPREIDPIKPVEDEKLQEKIRKRIHICDLLRSPNGILCFTIRIDHPPVDLAFHVAIEAANRRWKVGDIFAAKDSDSDPVYNYFNVKDTQQMPGSGLVFEFKADPDIARETVGNKEVWNGDIKIGGISTGSGEYLDSQP